MKTIKFFAIAALFLGFSVSAMSQNTANANASASANLIKPISIEKQSKKFIKKFLSQFLPNGKWGIFGVKAKKKLYVV